LAQGCNIPLAIPFSELANTIPLPDKQSYPSDLQSIGDHIKYHRLTNNIRIKEVIEQLQIDRETLRGWELNLFTPFVKHYPAIINLLGYYPFNEEMESLGGKIKRYRFTNGITQEQFALLLDTDRSTVSQWENNKYVPLLPTKKRILELLSS
jgi:DNA-binding XRE family transcriptional regulator